MAPSDPQKINASPYYLDRHVTNGDAAHTALRTDTTSWTYGQLLDQVKSAARTLLSAAVKPGDRVILIHPDDPHAVAFLLAAMRIGAAPAPIPTQLTDDELAFIWDDCDPAAVIVDSARAQRVRDLANHTSAAPAIVVLDDEQRNTPPELAPATGHDIAPVLVDPDAIALLQYTSGSTGTPKGVVHLHRGLLALPEGFGRRLELTPNDTCYSAAKLSFGYGLGNSVFFPLAAGATTYLRDAPSDPLGVLQAIQSAQPTVVFVGPTLYAAIAAIPNASAFALSSVRLYVSAGDMLSAALFERWENTFGHRILDGLGSTECLHIFMSAHPGRATAGKLGSPIAPYQARLVDDAGQVLECANSGLLEVKGPANFARYWNRPAQTEATLKDGWVRTGDVLDRDDDGNFSYVGRSDDIFKVHEMKVSPVEIEHVLNAHPAVAESAVVGRPDSRGLPSVCAFLRLAEGHQPTNQVERELRASVRNTLSAHKVPKMFEFVTALPRTSTGKLTRHMLRTEPLTTSAT
jgi:benzoate-CoA ligase family protein